MAQHSPNCVGFALVLLLVLQLSQAVDKCKTGCDGASGPLKLTPGTTYKYDYDGKINILLSSAEGQQTSTEVKATVLLTQQADCSQVLRLQNVQVIGPDGKKRTGIPDVEKPVVLNNNNGALNEFICSEPQDSQNSLNLKRAIASFFQVNTEKSSEIDVFGQCPIQVSKSQDGDITTITKNKNLNKCAFRESITHNYITSTFNIHSQIQSSPVLNANLDSKQKIKGGVLDSATIVENYMFVPFSVGQNGAKATIESKLTLAGTSKDAPTTKCQVPKSIIFENPHPVNVQKSNTNIILKKVKEIAEQLGVNVEGRTALQFVNLVKLLRVSRKSDILSVYNQVRSGVGFADKEGAKKIFLDAILVAGNGDTLEVAIELLKNKELGPFEERQLYMGLARARHATENSIKTATDLLNRANLPREAYLGVGSLAGRYCATHNCEKVEVVNKIIQKLLSKLGDLKAANRKEESDMIFVLKGLTNVGYLNDAILSKLVSLAEDQKQPTRLRVATLEAYLAAPCKDKLRDSALKTLKDVNQDAEIRIKAYLALTGCPNDKIGNAVKALLEQEKSNQVGGFISSHIRNLRSSANPDKSLAKTYLGFIHTPNRFKFDPRKYSFNGEFSNSIDALGLANSVEGNVIYSQNSWLPRSTNLNLTAEVFGQRFNFLEIAARQENLDKVIEHYLGPQGVLRKATLQQNWDQAVKPVENLLKSLKEKVDKSLRARRDVSKAQIDAINKKVQIRTNELDKNLDLDLSIKNFGSEIVFMNSFDVTEKLSPQSIIDTLVGKLNEGLDKLKNFEKIFRSNLLFLDAELSYPTALGFPLRLGLNGASNIQVKAAGSIDARELLSKNIEKDQNLKISIIPSATVTIVGKFSLDTILIENGLEVASTLHTSSGGELEVNGFKQGLGLDVKFSFPVQKQELIGLQHNIIFQSRENGVALQNQRLKFSQNKDFSICIDHLMNYIGLEFCADINGPNLSGKKVPILPFPLSGDAKASIRVERGDIDTFHYRREFFTSKEGKVGVKATLETLDKNNKQGVGLDVEGYLSPEKYIKATLNSPIKSGEAEARLILNDQEKVLALSVKDETKEYTAKAGLKVSGGSNKRIYNPILEYTTPGSKSPQTPPFHVEGKIIAEQNGNDVKYTFDNVKLVIPGQRSIALTGNIGTEGPAYYSDLTASDGKLSGSLKGRLQAQPNLLKIQAELRNSLNPTLNFNVKGEFKKQSDPVLISSNVQLTYGADLNSKTNVITMINSYSLKNIKNPEVTIRNKLSYPLLKIDAKLDFDRAPKSLDYDTYLQYGNAKIGSEMKLKYNTKSVGDYQLELDVSGMKNKVELKSSRLIVGPDDSKIDNSLSVNGKKLEVSGKIKYHLKPNDVNVGADLVIKVPTGKAPWKLNEGLKLNPKEIDFHLKLLSGSNPLIDTLLKANRNGNVNGNIKVNFKDVLNVNGQIKAQKGSGSGNILVEAKSLKKSAKAETTFTIHSPTYNIDVTFYPLYNEDKNKKVALSTKNKYTGSTLNSASTVDILGSKLALNAKAQISSIYNGKTAVDVDLTLPGQQYLIGKLVRDVSSKDGLWTADDLISLEQRDKKESPGRKIVLKGSCKDTSITRGIVDAVFSLAVNNAAGQNVNINADVKRLKNGDKWNVNVNNKITASFLKDPIETSYASEYKKYAGNFNLKTSACPKSSIQVQGKYDASDPQKSPITGDVKIDLLLPVEILSSVNIAQSFSVKKSKTLNPSAVDLSGSLKTVSSNPNLNIDINGNLKTTSGENSKSGTAACHGEINKPFKSAVDWSGKYVVDTDKKTGSISGNIKAILPQNQIIQGSSSLARVAPKEYKLEGSLDLPTQSFKSNKWNIHSKCSDNNDISTQAEIISDGKKYSLNSDISLNSKEPSIDIKITNPDGKISELSANIKRPGEARLLSNIKLMCQCRDFLLEGGLDVNSQSLNNFYVQVTANSPKLNIKNVLVKVGNAGSSDGKTLKIEVSSAGKNIVSGSATVSSREEQGKFIIEGSGNFKVNDQDKSGNFKFIKTSLTSDKNGETGEEISFDATLGNKAIDAELKLTNKEFRYLNSYCEESKQCAHVEIDAKTSIDDISRFENKIEITIDLRVLGVPNEFGLKAVTNRNNWVLDHTVDVHFENAANKYQYSLYIHPKEVGLSLTTPKRIIALEANADLPSSNIRNGGKATGEIAFYTDKKNNPSSKSALNGLISVDVEKRSINAELNLNIVGQSKPLSIKYTRNVPNLGLASKVSQELILDIFGKADQKIVVTQTYSGQVNKDSYRIEGEYNLIVKSVGLGMDLNYKYASSIDPKGLTVIYDESASILIGKGKYDSALKVTGSPKGAYLLVKHLNQVLLEAKSDINLQKGLVKINTHTSGLGLKPVESILEIKNYNTLKFIQYLKNDPDSKLQVTAALIPGQIADARAEFQTGGAKKELFHVSLSLDDKNFLKPDAAIQTNNVKELSEKVKNIVIGQVKESADKIQEGNRLFSEDLKNAVGGASQVLPDSTNTIKFYESEMNKFKEELATDKTLQDLGELLKNVVSAVATTISRAVDSVSQIVEKIFVSINSAVNAILQTIQTKVLPTLRELAEKILSNLQVAIDRVSDVVFAIVAKGAELLEAVRPQLNAINATISEITEEIGKFLVKTYRELKTVIVDQLVLLKDEIKSSPIFAELKAQYEDFIKNGLPSQEVMVNTMKAVTGVLKEAVLVPEFQNVIDLIEKYLEKKLTNKPVDDMAEIQKISITFGNAVTNFASALSQEAVPDVLRNFRIPSLNFDLLKRLPSGTGSIRVSALEHLLREDTSPIAKFLLKLILTPIDYHIPNKFSAKFTGSTIFTFDNSAYYFPGSCSYLAARDAVNGNFSVIITFGGKTISGITYSDKTGSVTIKKDELLFNNAKVDIPFRKGGIQVLRSLHHVSLKSSQGVRIECEPHMLGCYVEISGFYHGQIRGIFGNANNEKYDDFMLPNGKIVSSISETAAAYAIGSSDECKPVVVKDVEPKPDPRCESILAWDSPLRHCMPFIEHEHVKKGCEHSAAIDDPNAFTAFAVHYTFMCWDAGIPVRMPVGTKYPCSNGIETRKHGDQFNVKLPGKSADVLLVVNTNKHTEGLYNEYVPALISEVTKEYKSKGINDVQFQVIAFGGENQKPVYATVGGKLGFKSGLPNLKFAENPKVQKLVTGYAELDRIIGFIRTIVHDAKLALGWLLAGETYVDSIQYPFRAESIRSIIGVTNDPCESGMLLPLQVARGLLFTRKDINLNVIAPAKNLKLKDAKTTEDVIGFTSEKVITLSNAAAKPTGDSTLQKDLTYNDICLDNVINVGGNVFIAENLIANKNAKQQIAQVVAKNVVSQSLEKEVELECTCDYTYINPFIPYNRCRVIDVKDK